MLSAAPTLANVRTFGLLADGGQLKLAQLVLDAAKVLSHWDLRFKPRRQPQPVLLALFALQLALVGAPVFPVVRRVLHELLETGATFEPLANLLQGLAGRRCRRVFTCRVDLGKGEGEKVFHNSL